MESNKIIPKGILFPFILLTTLFFAWAVPNNLTDTMLAAFKRIMSMSDSKTAWIQVVCYLLGYGCCAVPGALFIKKYTYLKSATKLFSVLLASKRPLITELADKLRLKYPLLPTISPCPTMRLEAIRSIIPISCRRYPKSV